MVYDATYCSTLVLPVIPSPGTNATTHRKKALFYTSDKIYYFSQGLVKPK